MIVGIGSDLCNIERIQNSLDRWGDKFLNRVFTDIERAKAAAPAHRAPARSPSASPPRRLFRKRSAPASSAASIMKDIGVVNLPSGAPTLSSPAEQRRGLTPLRRKATPSTFI